MAEAGESTAGETVQQRLIAAQQCLRQAQPDRAASILAPLLEAKPVPFEVHLLAGIAALQGGNAEAALTQLQSAVQINPGQAVAHANLGLVLKRLGRDSEARDAYQRALALNPNDLGALSNMGSLLAQNGQHEEAADCFRRAAQIAPENPAILCNQAASLLAAGLAGQAVEPLERAARLAPGDFMVCFNLAQARRHCDQLDAAFQALQRCFEITRDHPGVWFELAQIQLARGQLEQASETAHKALALDDQDVDGWRLLGSIEKRRGNIDQARQAWQQAQRIDPDDVGSQYLLDALDQKRSDSAPKEYVRELFDRYAPRFERHLRDQLQYRVPEMLWQLMAQRGAASDLGQAVDLGCGTGLMAPLLAPHCRTLLGVDLSPRMLRVAEESKLYHSLAADDVVDWLLAREPGSLDLAVAADVLCYIGDLTPVHQALARALATGGYWLFSVEALDEPSDDWTLRPSGRFAHGRSFVERLLEEQGFRLVATDNGVGRKDQGEDITVLCVLAQRLPSV